MRTSWTILLHGVSLCIGSCVVSESTVATASYQNVYEVAKISKGRSLRSAVKDREATDAVIEERMNNFKGLEEAKEFLLPEAKTESPSVSTSEGLDNRQSVFDEIMGQWRFYNKISIEQAVNWFVTFGVDPEFLHTALELEIPIKDLENGVPKGISWKESLWLKVYKLWKETHDFKPPEYVEPKPES
ncbi:unnamed protein product [Peronospora farinosa]|uniref:RxLR effector protein n=1 Tax=Peronospora farinosa TaxID=134698 RepID=A0AAV0TLF6_9STRA|nr:unnamed protein product [Peronospora farinosa]CAI5722103.1 unnamed protein product [Peronospora farinosa]CAI5722129.1 unnamed protein product [Peronospora farinosa]